MLADINGNVADLRSEAAMASQRFCLRWNNHQSNLLNVFDQLLHDESFVDVTLAVEGQLLRAHKMVLSACSPYFQALFVGHPDRHPIVILKDVPYVDMRSLLDFMYRGEVSVDQDRLTAFLRVAESLRIKGLTEVNEDKCELPSITSSLLGNQNAAPPPPPNLHRINQVGQHHHMPQKRYHHMSSHPLLGSALTAPKRKRGRPRKLSGSSDTPLDTSSLNSDQQCSGADLVQGSPEMMEMKMGLDFQSEAAQNSSSNASNNNAGEHQRSSSAKSRDEPTENGTDQDPSMFVRIKGEPEPTPSTSAQAKDEAFTRPLSRQGSESYKQGSQQQQHLPCLPSDITFEICGVGSNSPEGASANHLHPHPSDHYTPEDFDPARSDDDCDSITSASDHHHHHHHHHHQQPTSTTGSMNSSVISDQKPPSSPPAASEGVHFLTDGVVVKPEDPAQPQQQQSTQTATTEQEPEVRKQLLEYLIQKDGSVVCKWCGEVLPSRTRWYRHKYKLHVTTQQQVSQAQHHHQPPAPLFKCHSCNAYFKSRKGYIGHLSSRHAADEHAENDENRELVLEPGCITLNGNKAGSNGTATSGNARSHHQGGRGSKPADIGKGPDWEQQREKEEKLVADIIDRVKRECEAQGETVTRRGYSRRSTVMNS